MIVNDTDASAYVIDILVTMSRLTASDLAHAESIRKTPSIPIPIKRNTTTTLIACQEKPRYKHKPHPETFLKCAALMCVDPKFCTVLEDGKPGINRMGTGAQKGKEFDWDKPYEQWDSKQLKASLDALKGGGGKQG